MRSIAGLWISLSSSVLYSAAERVWVASEGGERVLYLDRSLTSYPKWSVQEYICVNRNNERYNIEFNITPNWS